MVREELPCQRERANPRDRDPFAMAVLKDEAIVGFRDRSWSDGSGQGALGDEDGSVSRGCRYR